MTHQEILETAIRKALDAGWKPDVLTTGNANERARYVVNRPGQLYEIIFSHDFAKPLWGDEAMTVDKGCAEEALYEEETPISEYWRQHFLNSWNYDIPMWAYHLSQMVLADDPIKYLGENIPGAES